MYEHFHFPFGTWCIADERRLTKSNESIKSAANHKRVYDVVKCIVNIGMICATFRYKFHILYAGTRSSNTVYDVHIIIVCTGAM